MTAGDDDWPAVAGNLKKAKRSWGKNEPDPDEGGSDGKDLWDVLQERHPADPSFRS